jgi:hypothetical protein
VHLLASSLSLTAACAALSKACFCFSASFLASSSCVSRRLMVSANVLKVYCIQKWKVRHDSLVQGCHTNQERGDLKMKSGNELARTQHALAFKCDKCISATLLLSIYVCMSICMCAYAHVCVCILKCIQLHMCTYVCLYVCLYASIYVFIRTHLYECVSNMNIFISQLPTFCF